MTASASRPDSDSSSHPGGARLLADIGGTNARFALETGPGRFEAIEVLSCHAHDTLGDAIGAYLALPQSAALHGGVRHAAIAIANPVSGDQVRMTNHHWAFSIEALRRECGFDTLVVVNDFSALARSLPHLGEHKRQVGGGAPESDAPLGLLGAGTGLGVSGLVPAGQGWTALRSEGGHVSFSPVNETEVAILQYAWREFEHVSSERLLSGAGVELIYRALAERAGRPGSLAAPEISRRALSGECALCDAVVEAFCGMLGTAAGNLAITLGAQGGVYIGGGIVPRLGERFVASSFRSRFEQKGRFSAYLAQVPTYVITAEYPAFLGVSAILSEKLDAA
ncbi:glucokinase [Massilia yuzhufengensis]|uniref:Glucokinase n=1 Tax=Massilia yuzhufengensis TaxID=1164594 RepID=A0A1I1FZJ6_9BURK|nr:glucokinase [Massilia yuzhufengensis]SFC04705.1 glucokinase [Massilia yuzhufengensis]